MNFRAWRFVWIDAGFIFNWTLGFSHMAKTKKNWKAVRACSLVHGLELCLEFARVEHNRSVQSVAELMGLSSHWTLYKWLENGRMPANLIRPFEHACGCHFVSDWLALSAGRLVIDMPRAKRATAGDINGMQSNFSHATGLLIDFYSGVVGAEEAVAALTAVLVDVASQRANVAQAARPELGLFEGNE